MSWQNSSTREKQQNLLARRLHPWKTNRLLRCSYLLEAGARAEAEEGERQEEAQWVAAPAGGGDSRAGGGGGGGDAKFV